MEILNKTVEAISQNAVTQYYQITLYKCKSIDPIWI